MRAPDVSADALVTCCVDHNVVGRQGVDNKTLLAAFELVKRQHESESAESFNNNEKF